jgi:outer membrane protein, multidrug efflux system
MLEVLRFLLRSPAARLGAGVALGLLLVARARADEPPAGSDDEETPALPRATIQVHRYSLAECLALADRNHPNLWAARARLANVHAQVDEARYTPFFQWSAQSGFGVLPTIAGTPTYTQYPQNARDVTGLGALTPFMSFDINGVVPVYTFGKITNAIAAAEANVRVNEWDLEKFRQQMRMDVRKAYYGVQLARDVRYVVDDALRRLDKGIEGIKKKLADGDKSVEEVDRLRLEVFREEVVARSGDANKGELTAMAALRFLTGVQATFDIPDEPLKRPDRPLVAVAQYLQASRLFRPEINMARAGVEARKRQVDLARSRFFPDFGVGLSASYAVAPSAVPQQAWAADSFNHFYYGFAFGMRWSLDLLPNAARVDEAESQLEETRALERLAVGGAQVEVETAYAAALEAKNREEAWDRAEHKSKEWISTVEDHIDLGTWDERWLLEPLRAYGNARVSHLQALMDYNVAMSQLALASGWDSAAPTGE